MRTRLLVAGEERKQLPQSLPICRPEGVERGLTVSCGSLIAFSAPQSQILAFIRPETVDHGKTMSPCDREMVMRVTGRPVGSLLSEPPEMQLLTRCAPLLPRKHCWQVSSSSPLLSDDRPSDVQNPLPPIRELSSCLHQQGSQNRESVGDSDEVGSDFFLTVAPNFLLWPEGLRNLQL